MKSVGIRTRAGALVSLSLVFMAGLPAAHARDLSFDDRVAAQKAIEQVYWKHRIWPKENPGAKPPLSAVMPDAAVRERVEDYLRMSALLESYWRQPITADQLQAELSRMTRETKAPGTLRELFAALHDDPILIAECLARPTLAQRRIEAAFAGDTRIHGARRAELASKLAGVESLPAFDRVSGDHSEIAYVLDVNDTARRRLDLDPADRAIHLTRTEWDREIARLTEGLGAQTSKGLASLPVGRVSRIVDHGDRFVAFAVRAKDATSVTVASVSTPKRSFGDWARETAIAPTLDARALVPARKGYQLPAFPLTECTDDTWAATDLGQNVPSARGFHTAVWTGSEMIVWGGSAGNAYFNSGGRYDPATDSWAMTSLSSGTGENVPEVRTYHVAVWTGSEVIVWGGFNGAYLNTGGRYNPATDRWAASSLTDGSGANTPDARRFPTAVWTGSEMIVWGGFNGAYLNTGGRYDPATDTWAASSLTTGAGPNVPSGRRLATAVWTGSEMIVWGGDDFSAEVVFNTGGRYNPVTDSWAESSLTTGSGANAPGPHYLHSAVWTGTEMIVWGGLDDTYNNTNAGGRYNPSTDSWAASSLTTGSGPNVPNGRNFHTAIWTGTDMIVWGGNDANSDDLQTGGRYNPATDSWTLSSLNSGAGANTPTPRSGHTAVWTGTEMIVWGGKQFFPVDLNFDTGGRYDPVTDSWLSTESRANAPSARFWQTAVWTGAEMIVWGGFGDAGYLNNGGTYDPATNSWASTSLNEGTVENVPDGRVAHTAVWTGSEMIVWGGYGGDGSGDFNTGGRYNPATDSWSASSLTSGAGANVPDARDRHTAIWTGSEMIVWGGINDTSVNTGGRFNPSTDSWEASSLSTASGPNVPDGRFLHTAVWTGTEMIVWGGYNYNEFFDWNNGGRYNPSTDTWAASSLTTGAGANVPSARDSHTAIWTGSEMIVWGGFGDVEIFNTGGRYNPSTDAWSATSLNAASGPNVPSPRFEHTAVWTGSEMIVWGGTFLHFDNTSDYFNTGGRYDAATDTWRASSLTAGSGANTPGERSTHTAVWTGSEMIVWGGLGYISFWNDGGRYCAAAVGGCTDEQCDDGNPCTDDSCDLEEGCLHANNDLSCDDGNACTTGDVCAAGSCTAAPIICDDNSACTNDACNPDTGECEHANIAGTCDDGNECTAGDTCVSGLCVVPVSFTQPEISPIEVGLAPLKIVVGDVNRDGDADLVVMNYSSDSVTTLLGDGAGGFTEPPGSPVATDSNAQSITLGDFNVDGKLDFAAVQAFPGSVLVYLGDGTGRFIATTPPFVAGDDWVAIETGDFNLDGKPDVVVADGNAQSVSILLGDGTGGFSEAAGSPIVSGTGPGLVVADFNRDGRPDVAVVNQYSGSVVTLLGDGLGGFVEAPGSPVPSNGAFSLAVGDFNRDGIADLTTAGFIQVTTLLGDGAGGFTASVALEAQGGDFFIGVSVGDFNTDRKADVVALNYATDELTLLLGDGSGGFVAFHDSTLGVGDAPSSAVVADFNHDGRDDLAVANFGPDTLSNTVTILLNDSLSPADDLACSGSRPGSDWPNSGGNAARNGLSSEQGPQQPQLLWSGGRPSVIAWQPVTEGGRVFMVRQGGSPGEPNDSPIVATDLDTGAELWATNLPFNPDDWTTWIAGVKDGRVYASRSGGDNTPLAKLYALDATSGAILWSSQEEIDASSVEGVVFAPDGDPIVGDSYTLRRINSSDGTTAWSRPGLGCATGGCGPAVFGSAVYLASYNGISRYDLTTGELEYSSAGVSIGFGQAPPMVGDDGTIYIGRANNAPEDNRFYAFTDTGTSIEEKWSVPVGSGAFWEFGVGPDGSVYMLGAGETIDRLNPDTGALLNQSPPLFPPGEVRMPRIAIDALGRVFVSNGSFIEGVLFAFDADLTPRWDVSVPNINIGGPVLGRNGTLVVCGIGTDVRAYRAGCFDADGDGFTDCAGDCNDDNAGVHPGAIESCNDLDDDCDGTVDNGGDALCDDGNPCTSDACDPIDGCSHSIEAGECDDGNPCTTGDVCLEGVCVGEGADCVVAFDPANNATDVAVSTNVTLTYHDPIDPATVTSSTFRLTTPGSEGSVPATLTVSSSGTRATLDPTSALAPDTTYRVEATSGIDGPGEESTQPFTSYFRTGAATATTAIATVSEETDPLPTLAKGGSAVAAAGDLNNDGLDDFISGAPGYADSAHGVPVEAGAALVYLGSAGSTERAGPDIIFTGIDAHDRAGVSVAGDFDFNGDGRRDILIGAEQVDRTTTSDSPAATGKGKAYLIFFDPDNCIMNPRHCNPGASNQVSLALVGRSGGIPGVVFEGVALGDQAGFSVAGGGTSTPSTATDIIIGAPGADPLGVTDAGAAYIVFDNPGLSGDVSLAGITSVPQQVPGKAYYGSEPGEHVGFSVAFAGPLVSGQPVDRGTVLIGAPDARSKAGRVIAPPGDPDTTPIIVDAVGRTEPGMTNRPGFQILGTQPGEQLGWDVADGGDAMEDGVSDLLIGAPAYDVTTPLGLAILTDAGRVLETSQTFVSGIYNADAVGTSIGGAIWQGAAMRDQLGFAVTGAGDVTGDGYADIVLGAPFVDPIVGGAIRSDAGAVYVINGSPSRGPLGLHSVADVGTTIAGQRLTGTEAGEHAGSSIAGTGDINGDGRNDFVVGAPDRNDQAGTVYMVLHATTGAPVGSCGPQGCVVADLPTGAEVDVPAGGLTATIDITVAGLLDSSSLPAPVPAGKVLLGAARFTPNGQPVLSPFATIYIPTTQPLLRSRATGAAIPIFYFNGTGWVNAGIIGTGVANPSYPSRSAVKATADVLRTYAVFVDDCVTLNCDDGNPCTDDGCATDTGCFHTNNTAPCDDGNLCTTGDTCTAGICTPTFNGLNHAAPKSSEYYRQLCERRDRNQLPWHGDQLTVTDAVCVGQLTATFSGIATLDDLCGILNSNRRPPHGGRHHGGSGNGPGGNICDKAENELVATAINICRARVCEEQNLDSHCQGNDNATVSQSFAEADAILDNALRTKDTCKDASCELKEINNGHALELNSLTLTRENTGVRLRWSPPELDDGAGSPDAYEVWRRPLGSGAVFIKLGRTTGLSFFDQTSGTARWEYQVSLVVP